MYKYKVLFIKKYDVNILYIPEITNNFHEIMNSRE